MPFGIIGRTGPGMRHVVGFGDRSTGRGSFGGKFGARHCNQWGLYGVRVRQHRDAALFPNYFGQTCSACCYMIDISLVNHKCTTNLCYMSFRLKTCAGIHEFAKQTIRHRQPVVHETW